jgi:3-hydroxy-9,10-secoandrosta-1,3,5(10)-triene-9,17-dione monooxygenase reductase component
LERVAGGGGDNAGMATGQEPIRVGSQSPFAVPPERRDPARRLRGRLVAPVTVWTAGRPPGGAALTVSSVLVAEGEPARLLGLIDPTSAFLEAAQETGAFVVHVLAAGDRALAERFSEVRPPIRGPFERLEVAESPWGPVLGGGRPHAACRLAGSTPVGYAELVEGVIEQLELPDPEDPLAYLHGSYRSVRELGDHG